jgi:beta-glucosidase
MKIRYVSVALVAAGVLAAGSVASSAPAPLRSSDEAALSPIRLAPSADIESSIDALIAKMTTKEKLQQVQLLSDGQVTDADAKAGVGGVFSLVDPKRIDELQHIAV